MDFFHSGDLGDIIYALPVVRAMGGGRLFLKDEPGVETTHRMTVDRVKLIGPLLVKQDYIAGVAPIFPPGEAVNLNKFRTSGHDFYRGWLPEVQAKTWGMTRSIASTPWIQVPEGRYAAPIIFSRSLRYNNPDFPWKRVIEKYGAWAKFIGTPVEHAAFNVAFGCEIEYFDTPTLLDAAIAIAQADLFVGNQSCPLAIAEGLKKLIVCEVCKECPNCCSPRQDFIQGWDAKVILPEV